MGVDAKYWAGEADPSEYGVPDDENPEWSAEDFVWAASRKDFDSDAALHAFLRRREEFLVAAETAGVPRATFLPFDPGKPGFEERARKALMALPGAVGWAAE
jgi:hypothetical protein